MINWERVKELENDIGPDDIDDVVELFLSEVDNVIEGLSNDSSQNTLEQDMHFLKGSALNLGFDVFGEMCSSAEKQAAAGNECDVSVPQIVASYESSKSEFLDQRQAG